MDNELISFRFQIGEDPLIYKDALVMTQEQYDSYTAEEIAKMQKDRYDQWYTVINTPAESEVIPVEEILQTEILIQPEETV